MNERTRNTTLLVGAAAAIALGAIPMWSRPLRLGLLCVGVLAVLSRLGPIRRTIRTLAIQSSQLSAEFERTYPIRLRNYFVSAAWFAGVVSLGELAYWTYSKEITGYRLTTFRYMWLIPIGYALIFAALSVIPACYRLALRPWMFVCSSVMAAAWVPMAWPGLYWWAVLVLSLGVGSRLAALGASHAYLLRRLVSRTVWPVCFTVAGMGSVLFVWPTAAEVQAIHRLATPLAARPNVLLIVLDTVRASSLSLYGYGRPTTPNLEKLAQRAVVFDRAYSTSPWTLPSHASMFTGRLAGELNATFWDPLDARYQTLAEALRANGYLTAGFVANTLYTSPVWGLARGFMHYEAKPTTLTAAIAKTSIGNQIVRTMSDMLGIGQDLNRKSAQRVNVEFLDWLSARPAGHPYFAFLNYYDAHANYVPPEPFATQFSVRSGSGLLNTKKLDRWQADEIRGLNAAYNAAIAYEDHQVGLLMTQMDERHELGNTIVIIVGDHGEQFGEHGLLDHAASLYSQLIHVPLLVLAPDLPSFHVGVPVSLRDLPVTVLGMLGLPAGAFPGRSLFELSSRSAPSEEPEAAVVSEAHRVSEDYPDWYPARKGPMQSVIFRGWHYIRNLGDGREELYSIVADPDERNDLATSEAAALAACREYLSGVLSTREGHR